jgi:PE family
MSLVIFAPEFVTGAASDLANIGSAISAANAAASAPTMEVLAAGADELSAAVAAPFSEHAQQFQVLTARATAFHAQFAQLLNTAAAQHANAEAANVSPLQTLEQDLLGVINAPTNFLLGRPLIGPGTNGAAGTGQNGGPGGILWGNGGHGGSGAPSQAGGPAGPFGQGGTGGTGGPGVAGGTPGAAIPAATPATRVSAAPPAAQAPALRVHRRLRRQQRRRRQRRRRLAVG